MQAYYSGKASPGQLQDLEAWLREDPKHVRLFVDLALLDGLMLSMQKDEDAAAILSMLAEAEANAEPDFSLLHIPAFDKPFDESTAKTAGRPITFRKGWVLAGYAFNKALHTKAGVIGSIAAVLVLGAVLMFALLNSGTSPARQQQIADNTPTEQGPANPVLQPTVATLTATNNAQWTEGVFVPGMNLRAGQRLTLTQGIAEITTKRGAIAILEAPATIELFDNDNALRLHTGKLVGICKTPLSKGFLVRTPHMDVTDLGTRFGVDSSEHNATEVHVFEGEVHVARAGVEPVFLAADQSAKASAGSSAITAIGFAPERFTAALVESGLRNQTVVLDTDIDGFQWLLATSERAGSVNYLGNRVTSTLENEGFTREIGNANAYGFIQHRTGGAGVGEAATARGTWTFSNLPAGRYDVATAFEPKKNGASAVRYTVNGVEVFVDQSSIPGPDAGPTFESGLETYNYRTTEILFTQIGSSVAVPEGGSITVTIDNSNCTLKTAAAMDTVAITLAPEASPN